MYSIFKISRARAALFPVLLLSLLAFLPAAKSDPITDAFPTIPEANWTGLRLIILPQSKALQHYGYQEMYQDTPGNKDEDPEYLPLRYEDYVGKIVRVVSIGHGNVPNGEPLDEADLQIESNNKTIHGDIDHGCMADVAPVSDLETARKLYLGKTLWLASDHVNIYDPQKDSLDALSSSAWHDAFQKIKIKQYSPVKVVDIVPGWYASAPTRFIVQEAGTDGAQGYVDVHMSDTNVPAELRAVDRFENTFLESDPREKYLWSPKIWSAVEDRQVFPGMTSPQVRMSWGAPKEVRTPAGQTDTEQWVYDPTHILTLKAGVLEDISQ